MRNHPQPTDDFVEAISVGLSYWYERILNKEHQAISALDSDRHNLFQIIEFGMQLPQTWKKTAEILLKLYPFIDRRGYWRVGQKLLEKLQAFYPQNNPQLLIRVRSQFGCYFRQTGDLQRAIAIHEEAVTEARKQSQKEILGQMLLELQFSYKAQGLFLQALDCGNEALELLSENHKQSIWHIDVLRGVGGCLSELGKHEEAIEFLHRAVDLAKDINDSLVLIRSLTDLSTVCTRNQQIEQAFNYLEECQLLLEPTIYELDKVRLNNQMGIAYFNSNNWQNAELHFRKALSPYLNQSGHLELRIISLNNLGNALLKQGKLSEAEGYLRASLDLRPDYGDEVGWANTEGTLAGLLVMTGHISEAERLFQAAIEKLERFPNNSWGQSLLIKFSEQHKQLVAV